MTEAGTLGVCRWELTCPEPATVEVKVESLDMTTAACEEHADPHQQWASDQRVLLTPRPEPEPECWCPDDMKAAGRAVPYCPADGTAEQRGIDLD